MRRPNLLSSKPGRLATFFLLYMAEGLPQGYTATAVAAQMRREGVPTEQISYFIAMLYLPWAWKWLVGPVVDVVYSNRLGRRKGWIVGMQGLMIAGLMVSMGVDFASQIALYTAIIFAVNVCGATQDVAIDALACGVLSEKERGLVNGFMFAGAQFGAMVGGAGVLYLSEIVGFEQSAMLVIAALLGIVACAVLLTREAAYAAQLQERDGERSRAARIGGEIATYLGDARRAMLGSRSALIAFAYAALPCGSLAISLALGKAMAVELGMSNQHLALLTTFSALVWIGCCIGGAFLSDRWGRRKMLAVYVLGMCGVTAYFAWWLHGLGYVTSRDSIALAGRGDYGDVVATFWAVSIVFAFFQGLMYGTRTALFMDVCDPRIAATQFTAYMSILNLVIWYSGLWQGAAIKHLGYVATVAIDAGAGAIGLLLLPWIRPPNREPAVPAEEEPAT